MVTCSGISTLNGEEWQEQRKHCVKAMTDLGLKKRNWEKILQVELDDFVRVISEQKGQPFDFSRLLAASLVSNATSFIFGKRLPMTEENIEFLVHSIDTVFRNFSPSVFRLFFPSLHSLFLKLRLPRFSVTARVLKDLNDYIKNEIEKMKKEENVHSFVSDYLAQMEINKKSEQNISFNERNLVGNVMSILLGASESTKASLQWMFLLMAEQEGVQDKVHRELDAVLGQEGEVTWAGRAELPYTLACVMEGQRHKTVVPLNATRVATEDLEIGGYTIPVGTFIIANIWGLHNDPKYWDNPEKFQPERFLMEDGTQVNFKPKSYSPFSYGKRMCPGELVAMNEIFFYFAALMQRFRILLPEGATLNMEGTQGLTNQASPQNLRFVPRT